MEASPGRAEAHGCIERSRVRTGFHPAGWKDPAQLLSVLPRNLRLFSPLSGVFSRNFREPAP